MSTSKHAQHDFKGFDDYIEVFRAGQQTDSQGRQRTWTTADLDQMVANHSAADAAPIVIGHPANDASSPAYGWIESLKRNGDTLLAKFSQVEPQFAKMAASGRFKNRSIRILKGDNGLRIGHVGWLGATPPAIDGLKPVEFSATGEVFDFSMEWRTPQLLARMMRNMRDFLIAQFGQEKADAVLPNFDIDELNRLAEQQYQEEMAEDAADAAEQDGASSGVPLPTQFSQQQDIRMAATTQAEIDAANQQASDFAAKNAQLEQQLADERNKRLRSEHQAFIDTQLKRGVKPALLEGAVDFMLTLDAEADGTFEFSLEGGAKKTSNQKAFVTRLIEALPVSVAEGALDFSEYDGVNDFSAPNGVSVDAAQLEIHSKAQAYAAANKVDYFTAVKAVTRG